ncbi:hypothetical protein BJ165DRAFT_1562091 [Panaeolus papilionaceus]|nr:hypothetical protein BJ165DRAFT_1562091 [Panaeolus papilionaceus]
MSRFCITRSLLQWVSKKGINMMKATTSLIMLSTSKREGIRKTRKVIATDVSQVEHDALERVPPKLWLILRVLRSVKCFGRRTTRDLLCPRGFGVDRVVNLIQFLWMYDATSPPQVTIVSMALSTPYRSVGGGTTFEVVPNFPNICGTTFEVAPNLSKNRGTTSRLRLIPQRFVAQLRGCA